MEVQNIFLFLIILCHDYGLELYQNTTVQIRLPIENSSVIRSFISFFIANTKASTSNSLFKQPFVGLMPSVESLMYYSVFYSPGLFVYK